VHDQPAKLLKPVLVAVAIAIAAIAGTVSAQTVLNDDDTILKQIIVFGRHSVRSSTLTPAQYAMFSPRAYPDFGVPAGWLTVHGQQAATLLGTYFRDYLLSEGLLTGDNSTDIAMSYFRANSIQRSNVTASMFGAGLIPGVTIPVHSNTLGVADPVFDPISAGVARVDPARAATEVQRLFGSGETLDSAYSGEFSLLHGALFNYPNAPQPPSIPDPTSEPIPLTAVTNGLATGNVVDLGGLNYSIFAADPLVMEYTDGMPLNDVAWGQLTLDQVSQQSRLVQLQFDMALRSPYLARVQSSNAAAHILRSMKQAVLGEAVPGAFSDPSSRVLAVISSDAYIAGLAGLLNLHWQLAGYQPDFCAPGGALIFELRQSLSTGEFIVRVYYTAQSFDQLRNLTPLNLDVPPETQQLLVPGGSRPGGSLDVEFPVFQKLVMDAVGLEYVENPYIEVPPAVLSNVPLQ
jgi:4-phytase/acid phosphatase